MIYVIGDSHVSVFSGVDKKIGGKRHIQPEFGTCYTLSEGQLLPNINPFEQKIPHFCAIRIGAHTAFNSFNRIDKIEKVISEYKITEKDFIVLCFGEIDIRNHIGFQAEKQKISIEESIRICVDRYMKTILYFKNKKLNVSVYGPPASSVGYKINARLDYKDVVTRNGMTLYFTSILRNKCNENEIRFFSIAKKMMLPNGTTDEKYIMDDIHLSQQSMPLIQEEFKDIIHLNSTL